MVNDARESRTAVSGTVTFASGDSGTSKDVFSIADRNNTSVNDYIITYDDAGTTTATVELYDDAEGTTAGNVSGKFDGMTLDPGDSIVTSDIARDDIENDVVAVVSSNDADVTITVGAYKTTG